MRVTSEGQLLRVSDLVGARESSMANNERLKSDRHTHCHLHACAEPEAACARL